MMLNGKNFNKTVAKENAPHCTSPTVVRNDDERVKIIKFIASLSLRLFSKDSLPFFQITMRNQFYILQ